MKHKVVTIVLVILAVALVAGAVGAYHTDRGKALAANAVASARQRSIEQLRASRVQQEYDSLNTQCKAGQVSYDGQTAIYKKVHARPVCDLPLVQ